MADVINKTLGAHLLHAFNKALSSTEHGRQVQTVLQSWKELSGDEFGSIKYPIIRPYTENDKILAFIWAICVGLFGSFPSNGSSCDRTDCSIEDGQIAFVEPFRCFLDAISSPDKELDELASSLKTLNDYSKGAFCYRRFDDYSYENLFALFLLDNFNWATFAIAPLGAVSEEILTWKYCIPDENTGLINSPRLSPYAIKNGVLDFVWAICSILFGTYDGEDWQNGHVADIEMFRLFVDALCSDYKDYMYIADDGPASSAVLLRKFNDFFEEK